MLRTIAISLALVSTCAFAQYKTAATGAPPAGLAAGMADLLEKQGTQVSTDKGDTVYEIWLRRDLPAGPKSSEENVSLGEVPHGSLLGVIRFAQPGADRRGQPIKPGVYTLRLSYFPVDGSHQGVSPQRDFLILWPAAADTNPQATPGFDQLVEGSRKVTGTPHPGVFSIWKGEGPSGLSKEGDTDWVWHTRIGSTPVSIILFGKYEG